MMSRSLLDDEFLDEVDRLLFEEYLQDPSMVLMEMASVVGNKVKLEVGLPFSFHFCDRGAVHSQHGIRAKILWNPSKAPSSADGYIELHGSYEYTAGSHKYRPTAKELQVARDFFKKYKVLFAAAWEEVLVPDDVADYLKGNLNWNELVGSFYNLHRSTLAVLQHCKNLKDLEYAVRKNRAFNMND